MSGRAQAFHNLATCSHPRVTGRRTSAPGNQEKSRDTEGCWRGTDRPFLEAVPDRTDTWPDPNRIDTSSCALPSCQHRPDGARIGGPILGGRSGAFCARPTDRRRMREARGIAASASPRMAARFGKADRWDVPRSSPGTAMIVASGPFTSASSPRRWCRASPRRSSLQHGEVILARTLWRGCWQAVRSKP